ncbi:non-ribosomal peptide synthetase [Micromonospora sp. NBC_00421]|uniref:non-ribosomal peptide synthetase n=1 Tax=Micromonospora sp. NBC_00421 TaxID=2975976 RepID=UPI002E22C656
MTHPGATYPMSFEQESIWLNDQMQEDGSRYVESWSYRLRGVRVDTGAVSRALNGIVARHEVLRSRLSFTGGEASQTVMPPDAVEVEVQVQEVTRRGLAEALAAAASRRIDLDRPPLLRATLLRLSDDDAILVVAIHHAVVDDWSFRVLSTEFSALYRAAPTGGEVALPAIPLQHGPYARERRRASRSTLDESTEHLRRALRAAPEESTFPADRPRPERLSCRGDRVEFRVAPEVGAGLRRLARRGRCTPFTVLAAALVVLISRHTGAGDVVIGIPVSRRGDDILDPMIGCLSDVMPLRQEVPSDIAFADLVLRVKEQLWTTIAHRAVPFAHLIRDLKLSRTPNRFPLFQVVLGYEDTPAPDLDLPGLTAERLYLPSGTAKYDIFLHVAPRDGGFQCYLEYAVDLYDRRTAELLTARLGTLLRHVAGAPETQIGQLDVIPPAERRIIDTWSREAAAPGGRPVPRSATDAFAVQARRTPDAPAIVDAATRLTYAQVDVAATTIAAHLAARGFAGEPIGVSLPRSAAMAVVVLGVLRAGSACLPLDPAYPADRIAYLVADSGIRVAIVQGDQTRAALPAETITVEEFGDPPAMPGSARPPVGPDDIAYLIYTSGSTGRPKGVAVPHRSLTNLLSWQSARSSAGPGTRTLQFAALSFDVAFQELFGTWATAGTLVVADDEARRNPARLLDLLDRERIDRVFLPFVALQQLAEYACATGRSVPRLTEVITAGEQLHATPAVREFFRKHAQSAYLENQYGPSETHVVTAERLGADPDRWPSLPPIGRPVGGARVTLRDGRLRLCPVGTVGEICVGGSPVALGYLSRPQLTGEKFVRDPLDPSDVIYRTGDLARYLPDGSIQWVGRGDDQIKVRGYRVELGEVTSAVQGVPGVAHAAVLPEDRGPDGKRLIAYYVPATGQVPTPETLRTALAGRLPEYLVPSAFVRLTTFPRRPSGKVDLAALPRIVPIDRDATASAATPTPTEARIADIWRDMLAVSSVDPDDDFFALGGHSLLATRLLLRVRAELGVEIPLSAILTAPTVSGLAAIVDRVEPPAAGPDGARPDLASEATLPADIVAAPEVVRHVADAGRVLLTGATGFLGAFTLHALLRRTRATVCCLVRGTDRDQAAARLHNALEGYGIRPDDQEHRIEVLPGDLAQPRLGLSESGFDELARQVDAVYHVGAAVHLTAPYPLLRPATVGGTTEILRLAARHRSVPVHYVSTVGVYAPSAGGTLRPDDRTGPPDALVHGYTQSKWVAEQLVEEARRRGLPATVYRPSRITGHSRTGACQSGDYLWLILKGCIQAGAAPTGVDTAFDLVPVNYVSNAMVALSLREDSTGRNFNLVAGMPVRLGKMVGWLRSRGYALRPVQPDEWLRRVEADTGNAAFPLLGTLGMEFGGAGSEGGLSFDTAATDSALSGSGVLRIEYGRELFDAVLDHFLRLRWLLEPTLTSSANVREER